jgi:hypothetical protein
MGMANLEFKTPSELLDDIVRLRKALEQIDAIAVTKKAGAAVKMQRIARAALALRQGERNSG